MNDNYFKTICEDGKAVFFWFNEKTTGRVYEQIKHLPLSLFRPTRNPGVWDRVALIGHRDRAEILKDLGHVRSAEKKQLLHEELDSLTVRYTDVGRFSLPLSLAAA